MQLTEVKTASSVNSYHILLEDISINFPWWTACMLYQSWGKMIFLPQMTIVLYWKLFGSKFLWNNIQIMDTNFDYTFWTYSRCSIAGIILKIFRSYLLLTTRDYMFQSNLILYQSYISWNFSYINNCNKGILSNITKVLF